VLADYDPDWHPTRYIVRPKRTRRTFEFKPVKILDWVGNEQEWLANANPAALLVLAHLKSRHRRRAPPASVRGRSLT
jgi:hypothetical protein